MPDFRTPNVKILNEGSFQESWPSDKGLQATMVYECDCEDRFDFMQELRGGYSSSARTFGQFTLPHAYPPFPAIYCKEITSVEGVAFLKDLPAATTRWAPHPRARVTALYAAPEFNLTAGDQSQSIDPGEDPPVLFCKMRIKGSAAFRTLPKGKLKFATSGKVVGESVGKPEAQSEISLEFPRVPFNPYPILRPYLGMINSRPMFGHDKYQVLFDAIDTDSGTFLNGEASDQSCALTLLARNVSWRQIVNEDGDYEDVVYQGSGDPIFQAVDLWQMFTS